MGSRRRRHWKVRRTEGLDGNSDTTAYCVRFKVSGQEFVPEKPSVLFEAEPTTGGTFVRYYDVASDGRFLMVRSLPEDVERGKKIFPSKRRIVQNWLAELDRLFAR